MAYDEPKKPSKATYRRLFAGDATREEKRAIQVYNLWKRTGVPPQARQLRQILQGKRPAPRPAPRPPRGLDYDRARRYVEDVLQTTIIVKDRVYSAHWPSLHEGLGPVNTDYDHGSCLITRVAPGKWMVIRESELNGGSILLPRGRSVWRSRFADTKGRKFFRSPGVAQDALVSHIAEWIAERPEE